jgi:hypothetical protein
MAGRECVLNLHQGLAMLKRVADALFHVHVLGKQLAIVVLASNSASFGAKMHNAQERRGIPRS